MADFVQAAQIAQTGLRDAAKGLQSLGQSNVIRRQAQQMRELEPGVRGELLAGDIQRGETGSNILKTQENIDRINPQNLLGKLLGIAGNVDGSHAEDKVNRAKSLIPSIVNLLGNLRGGKGGRGGKGNGKLDKNPLTWLWKQGMRGLQEKLSKGEITQEQFDRNAQRLAIEMGSFKTADFIGEKGVDRINNTLSEIEKDVGNFNETPSIMKSTPAQETSPSAAPNAEQLVEGLLD